jgi:hypothetical protein
MRKLNTVTDAQLWLAAGIVTTVILACTPKSEPKTVDYYVDNKEARLVRLKECENNLGTLKDDPDCLNAKQAAIKAWSKPNLPKFDASSPTGQAPGSAPASASEATR